MKRPNILCVAGGTGGHIFPAIAVAEELEKQAISFHFVTSNTGMGDEKLKEKGFEANKLDVRGFQISKNPFSGFKNNLLALKELVLGILTAKKLLKELKPDVILATGGYVAVPIGFAAKFAKVPLILIEPNAVPGKANKILSRTAKISVVGFAECKLRRAFYGGVPVRADILNVNRAENQKKVKTDLGVKEMLVVLGGSLGAKKINQTVLSSLESLSQRKQLSIYHIVGERDWNADENLYKEQMKKYTNYSAVKFENDMAKLLTAADLFVSRAGANVLAELDATGTPGVIIPWPKAAGNHQLANAKSYCSQNPQRSILLEEEYLTDEDDGVFANTILEFLDEKDLRPPKVNNSINREASKLIVDLLKKYCNTSKK